MGDKPTTEDKPPTEEKPPELSLYDVVLLCYKKCDTEIFSWRMVGSAGPLARPENFECYCKVRDQIPNRVIPALD